MKDRTDRSLLSEAAEALAAGHLSAALAGCEMVLARDPDSAEAWHIKGLICFAMQDHAAAAACYDRALMIMPQSLPCRLARATVTRLMGLREDALKDLSYVLEEDPACNEARQQMTQLVKE